MDQQNFADIPKAYSPQNVEDKWYKYWLENNVFHSEADDSKNPYTIVIPPPNITGVLHMGHILNNTIQDIYIRLKRMQGFNACWVPGTDHASIATEVKVINDLAKRGIDKFEIGREEFLKHCYAWKDKYGGIIIEQLKKLGVSCDWSRERFTMDEHYYSKVVDSFVQLYKEGKIYRGYRMVNWCPVSKSAISDEEVIPRETKGSLWYIKYPVAGSDEFLIVATTRPETMLGDTGVAVNPEDERYKNLIGKNIELPLTGRVIPIFADQYVDKEFGTGAVKVTPAHDFNDYDMAMRHNLEFINIFNEDATTNHNVPEEFRGLDRYECRKKVVARLEEFGLLVKTEDYTNNVGYSERGGVPIEPYISEQWFMKMDELSKSALDAVTEGQVRFHPSHWVKTYEHWMSNIKDWCISRQLWWGHRIPVWYHKDTKEIYCNTLPPADSENWHQDEDVLDTWASSWLWAHDVFTNETDQKYYYPTDLLVTAPDIIFFWVARMIMAGQHFMKDIPFRDVYFTSVIRDLQGRKMSKSLGNSPDPLDVIRDYGADAMRFTIIYLAPLGQDIRFSVDKCELGRNFANKIWNAGRFLLMNAQTIKVDENKKNLHRDVVDDWIDSRFTGVLNEYNKALDRFEINNSIKLVYSYVWNDFCDWYVELIKNKLYSGDEDVKTAALTRALDLFEKLLQLVHPFMPFITEELWHLIKPRVDGASISLAAFPAADNNLVSAKVEERMNMLMDIITAVRNIRGEMNIPPSRQIQLKLKAEEFPEEYINYIKKLAKAESVEATPSLVKPDKSASAVIAGCELFIPLEGIIDLDEERKRLQKEIQKMEGFLTGVEKKLSNESFVKSAPANIVEKEKEKRADLTGKLEKLRDILSKLS
ncbi:MAG: valine--tRNA ligase [Ignavibacteriaceae bacterium]|nr:valine--tRNA ligase [Ignavibacteriaceae bacterium]